MRRTELAPEDARRGLPLPVGVGLRHGADGSLPALFELEESCLGPRAGERRRFFFGLGRAAARDALAELGIAPVAIGLGASGEPLWPPGVVGAISHSGDLAVAVVGRTADYAGLGVDVEQLSPGLSARAARLVCTPSETAWTEADADSNKRRTMVFSAKEAVFKATYPIEHVWLGFSDAELGWDAQRCIFEARLLKQPGRFLPVGSILRVHCSLTTGQVLSTTYAPAVAGARRGG